MEQQSYPWFCNIKLFVNIYLNLGNYVGDNIFSLARTLLHEVSVHHPLQDKVKINFILAASIEKPTCRAVVILLYYWKISN